MEINKTVSLVKEWYLRIQTETPVFFRKLRNLGIWVAGIGASCVTADATYPNKLPKPMMEIAQDLIVFGGTVVLVASAACKNLSDIDQKVVTTQTTEVVAVEPETKPAETVTEEPKA